MNNIKMKTKVIDILKRKICNSVTNQIFTDYLGRGMFGRQCLAVSVDAPIPFIENAASFGLSGARYDSFGKGYIVYWPNYNEESEIDDYKK